MIKRRTITADIEHKIITGIIVSDQYVKQIMPMLRSDYFDGKHSAAVFEWVKEFFNQYKEAPRKHIEDIFKEKKETLDEDKEQLIKEFLLNISSKYEQETEFNVDYLLDQSTEYIKKKAIKITSENALRYLESGKIDKAEQELQGHRKLAKLTVGGVNPFDSEFIKAILSDEEENVNRIFHFPGALGRMSGWHERDWFVAVVAPMKRGKSFFLMEIAIQCILAGKKVIFFSLEMSEKRMGKRISRRISALGKRTGEYIYPCFDCVRNQDGTCKLSQRENKIRLLNDNDEKPKFDGEMKYRPCVACRGKKAYQVATWFVVMKRDKISAGKVIRKANSLMKMYGDNFRLKSYPANSANTLDLKSYIDVLEYTEDFVPDVIIIDYADILKTEDNRLTDARSRADETWKMLKNLADSRHCLVVTATQGTRKSIDKKSVGQTDISEDIRKLAQIDRMYGLSQTIQEKKDGIMRVSVIGDRDEAFDEYSHVICLQQRGLGQVLLDSELVEKGGVNVEDNMFSDILE